jgi:hypothetical protein
MSDAVFRIIAFEHAFRGSKRSHGWRYCFKFPNGCCFHHGIVFGPKENILTDLPEEFAGWTIPIELGCCECMAIRVQTDSMPRNREHYHLLAKLCDPCKQRHGHVPEWAATI